MTDGHRLFTGFSRAEIERKVDDFLKYGDSYKPIDLVLPASGATRYEYRGIQIREWHAGGVVRYDAAVEMTD